jgi:hypothetical protein
LSIPPASDALGLLRNGLVKTVDASTAVACALAFWVITSADVV